MSLSSPGIDLIYRQPEAPDRLALVVLDSEEFADPAGRQTALHRKLALYLDYVASGQFGEAYPGFDVGALTIKVVCRFQPTDEMMNIDGLRHRERNEVYLPVEIVLETEFRAQFQS